MEQVFPRALSCRESGSQRKRERREEGKSGGRDISRKGGGQRKERIKGAALKKGRRKGRPPSPKTNIIWLLNVLECFQGGGSWSLDPLPPGLL